MTTTDEADLPQAAGNSTSRPSEARHALRAINSLVKYAAEISDAAWPAAFDLACVEDDAQGERLSVIGEAAPDARVLHDERSTRELYRERGQNIRYAWVMAQGGLSGLDDGGAWRPYLPLRRGPGAFCFRP